MKRVLIAEDDESLRNLYSIYLEDVCDSVIHNDGKDALNYFKDHKNDFDVIVSDYMMPNMNGASFFREVRKFSNIPFVLCTGSTIDEEIKLMKDRGCLVIKKPFHIDELVDFLSNKSENV